MGFWNKRIFDFGLAKQAKFFMSSPVRPQPTLILEGGDMILEQLPLSLGYVTLKQEDSALKWLDLSQLKLDVLDKDLNVVIRGALLVTPKSYIPLDPMGKFTPEQREKIIPLDDVALSSAREAIKKAHLNSSVSARDRQLQVVSNGCIILMALMVIGKVISNAVG